MSPREHSQTALFARHHFYKTGEVVENATGISLNIRVLLGVVPWRLEPLDKCGGRLLFANEPD
jgi:hypothetical protein